MVELTLSICTAFALKNENVLFKFVNINCSEQSEPKFFEESAGSHKSVEKSRMFLFALYLKIQIFLIFEFISGVVCPPIATPLGLFIKVSVYFIVFNFKEEILNFMMQNSWTVQIGFWFTGLRFLGPQPFHRIQAFIYFIYY